LIKNLVMNRDANIIINDLGAIIISGLIMNNRLLGKSIVFLHGSEMENIHTKRKGGIKTAIIRYSLARVILNANAIVCVSEYMKAKFTEESKEIFYDSYSSILDKTHVIYTAIDKDDYSHLPPNPKKNNNVLKLVSVSRIEKRKGYDRKLKIFKKLVESGLQITWDIIGDGHYLNILKQKVKDLSLEKKIFFHGRMDRKSSSIIVANSDLFWLLSEYKESFGLVYLEANALGVPCLGYDRYGVREIIIHGVNGYKVHRYEECFSIIRGFDKSQFSKTCIIESTERFNEEKEFGKLENILNDKF